MLAALAAAPAFAAPAGKDGKQSPRGGTECTYKGTAGAAQKQDRRSARGTRDARGQSMDCIVVKGYPDQDGRADLRRSLKKEAKKGLGKIRLPGLKDFMGKKPIL
ncbi:MAG: hypothetical protein ACLFWF_09105 [Alphaproteobacteria bacterium]